MCKNVHFQQNSSGNECGKNCDCNSDCSNNYQLCVDEDHIQRDTRRKLIKKRRYRGLPNNEEAFVDGIPEAVPNYRKSINQK